MTNLQQSSFVVVVKWQVVRAQWRLICTPWYIQWHFLSILDGNRVSYSAYVFFCDGLAMTNLKPSEIRNSTHHLSARVKCTTICGRWWPWEMLHDNITASSRRVRGYPSGLTSSFATTMACQQCFVATVILLSNAYVLLLRVWGLLCCSCFYGTCLRIDLLLSTELR